MEDATEVLQSGGRACKKEEADKTVEGHMEIFEDGMACAEGKGGDGMWWDDAPKAAGMGERDRHDVERGRSAKKR